MLFRIYEYLKFILSPFFRGWWAIITGLATLLGYVLTPETGVRLVPILSLLITLLIFSLLFFALSVLVQGWYLFINRYTGLEVKNIQKNEGELVFILSGYLPLGVGTIVDIHRRLGDLEVPFALVKVASQNDKGFYQAEALTTAPAHLRDYNTGKFAVNDLIAYPFATTDRIREIPQEALYEQRAPVS